MIEEKIKYQDKLISYSINRDRRYIGIRSNKVINYSELKEIMGLIYNIKQHQIKNLPSFNSDFRVFTY